jgi:hypothetical protein
MLHPEQPAIGMRIRQETGGKTLFSVNKRDYRKGGKLRKRAGAFLLSRTMRNRKRSEPIHRRSFDLYDPFEGIAASIRHALAWMSAAAPPEDELRRAIGPPLRQRIERSLKVHQLSV